MEGKPLDYNNPMTSHPRGSLYIILTLPAFVNNKCLKIMLTITIDRKAGRLRETHTHDYFLATLILILSNGHYWIRTNDLLDVNEML